MAETQGRAAEPPVHWQARGELRNPRHVQPAGLAAPEGRCRAAADLPALPAPVDVPLAVDRSFRFVADEATAAAEDDESEEDVLALSRSFDLLELIEDELLMELPVAPRHEVCPSR